jgi:preprotein translocase subunit SecE
MKRQLQRQGQAEADGVDAPVGGGQPPRTGDGGVATFDGGEAPRTRADRSTRSELNIPQRIAEFFREVRSELRQVAWPTRAEVVNSATVVFITLVILVILIFCLDYAFSHSISWLYGPGS